MTNFYDEINKINNNINNLILSFLSKANELVELSKDEYQIERTFRLNKISLKGFILESSCCINLKKKSITDYTKQELKNYLMIYENKYGEDYSKYYLAIELYDLIEDIERIVDLKNDLELKKIHEIIPYIYIIKDADKNKYKEIYVNCQKQIAKHFEGSNKDVYNIYIQILNDIFDFYINGYPTIPEEYLYNN